MDPFQKFLHDVLEIERNEFVSRLNALEQNVVSFVGGVVQSSASSQSVLSFPSSVSSVAKIEAAGARRGIETISEDTIFSQAKSVVPALAKYPETMDRVDTAGVVEDRPQRIAELFNSMTNDSDFLRLVRHQLHRMAPYGRVEKCYKSFLGFSLVPSWMRDRCVRFLERDIVSQAIVLTILLNAVVMAIDSDDFLSQMVERRKEGRLLDRNLEPPSQVPWIVVADFAFAIIFTSELIIRFIAEEIKFFFGEHWLWNLLDALVVAFAWVEISLEAIAGMPPLRLFRLLRALKSFRLLRALRFFQLRLVLLSLFHSAVPLMWCCLSFTLILFVFALLFVQFLSSSLLGMHLEREEEPWVNVLLPWFQTSAGAMVSLFSLCTGGADWYEAYDAFFAMDRLAGILFIFYIVIIVLGVLNVIAAVFVQVAVEKARSDDTLALEEQQNSRKHMAHALVDVFNKIDTHGTHQLSYEEWIEFLKTKPGMEFLTLQGIDPIEAQRMFELLDLDGTGRIPVQEFVIAFMSLQGSANRLKQHEVEMDIRRQKALIKKVQGCIIQLTRDLRADSDFLIGMNHKLDIILKNQLWPKLLEPSTSDVNGVLRGTGKLETTSTNGELSHRPSCLSL